MKKKGAKPCRVHVKSSKTRRGGGGEKIRRRAGQSAV